MPHNSTIQELIDHMAADGSLTRSQARRVLTERIDLAKRQRLRDAPRLSGAHWGEARGPSPIVQPHNPERIFIATEIPKDRTIITEKQRRALDKQNENRRSQKLASQHRPEKLGLKRGQHKQPQPGTMTSTICAVLMDMGGDTAHAFHRLRAASSLAHLDDAALKQRISEVAWRYDL